MIINKMRVRFFLFAFLLLSVKIIAQTNDPVIMKVDGKDFKKSEFEYFYNKYNNDDVIDKRSLKEYIELFKNLKLKVAEAEFQGIDTTTAFLTELAGYRSAEAKPYLENMEINEDFIRKIYNRMNEMVEMSQIILLFPKVQNGDLKLFPSDTVEIYNKAIQIKNRLLKGENFEKIAVEFSLETGVPKTDRPGYFGWFSGLMLNPQFEDIVFNTAVGKIGELFRSNYGYHIVKVHAKKENPGQVNAAHILINLPPNADNIQADESKKIINEIYDKLMKGADFSELAKEHSNDPGSASNGGELGWFGIGSMVKEFQDVAFSLNEIGEISKPFKTQFGYHIVKLLGKKPVEPFDEKRKEIESKLNSGGYIIQLHQPAIENMKNEYGFEKDYSAYQLLFSKANTVYPTDSMFFSAFDNPEITLFSIGKTKFSLNQFFSFVKQNSRSSYSLSSELLNDRLQWFEYMSLNETKDKLLEDKYPEFKNLIQEYRDGILMFEISNKEVWRKASEDTEGLTAYYEKNKKNYAWDNPVYKGYIVLAKDTKTKKQMQKEIARKDPEVAVQFLLDNYIVGPVSYVKIEQGLFKKGDNPFVDEAAFKSGVAERPAEFQDFFLIGKILKGPESYKDIQGPVVTDYQNFLEENWIKELNKKYKVTIYPEVFETIK